MLKINSNKIKLILFTFTTYLFCLNSIYASPLVGDMAEYEVTHFKNNQTIKEKYSTKIEIIEYKKDFEVFTLQVTNFKNTQESSQVELGPDEILSEQQLSDLLVACGTDQAPGTRREKISVRAGNFDSCHSDNFEEEGKLIGSTNFGLVPFGVIKQTELLSDGEKIQVELIKFYKAPSF